MTRTLSTLATGGNYFEAPRWHAGRWWVSDIYAGVVRAYDSDGNGEEILRVESHPSGLGWLADGTMIIVSMHDAKLLRREADGTTGVYADLSGLCAYELNDMVIDEHDRAFVGTIGFAIAAGDEPRPGTVYRVDPDGSAVVAAEDLWCPNGMVITPDGSTLVVAESFAGRLTAFDIAEDGSLSGRRVLAQIGEPPAPASTAEMLTAAALVPDGCAIDAEGHIWVADPLRQRCVRISPAGRIVEELVEPEGRDVFACALGGQDGRTLLLCVAPDFFEAAQGLNAGQAALLTTTVDVPHGGKP